MNWEIFTKQNIYEEVWISTALVDNNMQSDIISSLNAILIAAFSFSHRSGGQKRDL